MTRSQAPAWERTALEAPASQACGAVGSQAGAWEPVRGNSIIVDQPRRFLTQSSQNPRLREQNGIQRDAELLGDFGGRAIVDRVKLKGTQGQSFFRENLGPELFWALTLQLALGTFFLSILLPPIAP